MNREILFKGKRADNGEWIEGYIIKRHGLWFLYDIKNADTCRQNNYLIEEDTICQYTGLKTMSGEKIWENDIIIAREKYRGIVKYEYGRFAIEWINAVDILRTDLPYWACYVNVKVIGNAFDTPNLLRKELDSVVYHDFMKKGMR